MPNNLTALFGGTFDPIHYGHLRPVQALAQEVNLTRIDLLPNKIPPHRPQPEATTAQRVDMIRLAIQNQPLFTLDTRELTRTDPSYTIDTLIDWRQEFGSPTGLAFIIGQDSLINLASWHRWQELLDYCHLLVCRRPGYADLAPNTALIDWFNVHQTDKISHLHQRPCGHIYLAKTPLEDISASKIRQALVRRQECRSLLPQPVLDYIYQQGLYGT